MADYDNTNSGVLFKNNNKTRDTQPAYRGSINVNGEEFWVSAWVNTVAGGARQGEKMINMKFDPKEESNGGQQNKPAKTTGGFDSFDDDIPFARLGREYNF